MTMTSNSPGNRALTMLKAHGQPMSEQALAVGLDVGAEEVGGLLGYPMRIGAIRRSRVGDHYYYRVGDEIPAPEVAAARPAAPVRKPVLKPAMKPVPAAAKPAPAKPPAPMPATAGPAAARVDLTLKIPTLAEHLARPPVEFSEDSAGDAAEIVEEAVAAALHAGVDIDAVHRREPSGITEARELVCAVLPLLQVRRFDCAQFHDGRLVLELDGTTHHLTAMQALQLYECMNSGSQIT